MKERIGINTKFYPHLLRHKRATKLYGKLAEKEMMELFGWRTRTMIDIYAHITQKHIEEKVLSLYGINNGGKKVTSEVVCPKCGTKNPVEANYCWRCGTPLRSEVIASMEFDKRRLRELVIGLLKQF